MATLKGICFSQELSEKNIGVINSMVLDLLSDLILYLVLLCFQFAFHLVRNVQPYFVNLDIPWIRLPGFYSSSYLCVCWTIWLGVFILTWLLSLFFWANTLDFPMDHVWNAFHSGTFFLSRANFWRFICSLSVWTSTWNSNMICLTQVILAFLFALWSSEWQACFWTTSLWTIARTFVGCKQHCTAGLVSGARKIIAGGALCSCTSVETFQ